MLNKTLPLHSNNASFYWQPNPPQQKKLQHPSEESVKKLTALNKLLKVTRKDITANESPTMWIRDEKIHDRKFTGKDNITRTTPDVLLFVPPPKKPEYRSTPGSFFEFNVDIYEEVLEDLSKQEVPFIEAFELIVFGRTLQRQMVFSSNGSMSHIGLGAAYMTASRVDCNTINTFQREFDNATKWSNLPMLYLERGEKMRWLWQLK